MPPKASVTPASCAPVSRSKPWMRKISKVKIGPQARMTELENAVDQWMP